MNFSKRWMSAAISFAVPFGVANFVGLMPAQAQDSQEIAIEFQGKVGNQPFRCGTNYTGLGRSAATKTATDFRFYVSDVALINDRGQAVALKLVQDNKWQYQNVALLDFEDKSGMCANGTVDTNTRIVGTVPKGKYTGLRFTLGVPFNLNHEDATIAPSPLNLTSMWWNWRGGYKFVRIDLTNPMKAEASGTKHEPAHGGSKPAHGGAQGFLIHLGSTGCQASSDRQKPASCTNPNTATITLNNFDPQRDAIVADLKALVANSNLNQNQPQTGAGCMSDPKDGDCTGIMTSLGLPWNGKPAANQTFFRVAPKQ